MLLLDDYAYHKTAELEDSMKQVNTMRVMIPPHCTSVVQPCDVGINKPLKHRLKHRVGEWRREKHRTITLGDKLPSPERVDVLEWLLKFGNGFSPKL